jgi:hypothetical protein
LVYIIHRERNMSESALICRGHLALDHFLVAENLKRRTIVATAWQTRMNATKMRVPK